MSIEVAEGFADLGLWQEAWDAIEDLDPDARMSARVWRVRLRCCVALESWDMGETLAELLAQSEEEPDLAVAAGYFHARAVHLVKEDLAAAKEAVKRACAIWGPARIAVLEDSRLPLLW